MARISVISIIMLAFLPGIFSQSPVYDVLLRSSAFRKEGNVTEAIRLVDDALGVAEDYRLFIERGESFLRINDLEEALRSFSDASAVREHSGSYGLARVFAAMGDVRNAVLQLEYNMNSPYRAGERRCFSDEHLHLIDNSAEWKKFWEIERYTEVEKILEETKYLTALGKSAEAAALLREADAEHMAGPEIRFADALVKFNLGDYTGAVSVLTGTSSKDMPAVNRDRLLAGCQIATGEYRKALVLLSGLISSEIPDARLFLERAEAYRGLSDFERALKDVDYYLSIYPDDPVVLGSAGNLSVESGNGNLALVYFNRLIEADPDSREAYISRGNLWGTSGLWSNAVSDYSMALDLDPFDGELYLNKGLALLNQGKTEQACHDFRMALKLGNKKAAEHYNRHCIK